MKAIVTVKLPRNKAHNPRNKKTGKCPLCNIAQKKGYRNFKGIICTDITGTHHSYRDEGEDLKEIENRAHYLFGHVTRIEWINE